MCRYLDALVGLRDSPFLTRCKRITRLRLQAELYSLTQVPLCCLQHRISIQKLPWSFHVRSTSAFAN